MPFDQATTARGAVAGALAAGLWAAQQPLDKKLFAVDYDDTELLGKTVTKGAAWPLVGLAMHVTNGAVFGAIYANVAPRIPLPSWARGPAAGLAEHVSTWPGMLAVDRFHPARKDLPTLATNPRAFAQATWRHLLFGLALGELERRLNAPPDPEVPSYEHVASTNGHGNLETALSGQPG
jgi:hypothetical protein